MNTTRRNFLASIPILGALCAIKPKSDVVRYDSNPLVRETAVKWTIHEHALAIALQSAKAGQICMVEHCGQMLNLAVGEDVVAGHILKIGKNGMFYLL